MHTLNLAILEQVVEEAAEAASRAKAVVVYAPHGHDVRRIARALTQRGLRHATHTDPDQLSDQLIELASGTIDALVTTDPKCAGWAHLENVDRIMFTVMTPIDPDDPQVRARVHREPAHTAASTVRTSRDDVVYAQLRARSPRLR